MTICPKCKQDLPDTEFYNPTIRKTKHGSNIIGSKTQAVVFCKKCHYERMEKYRNTENGKAVKHRSNNTQSQHNIVRNSQQRLRMKIMTHYGGDPPKCACCGESNFGFLTLDHINNDGNKDRKLHGYGPVLNMWIIKNNYPEGYQVLCFNCNCGKARNKGICPHKNPYIPPEANPIFSHPIYRNIQP